ncbi:MAG TPA: pyridoxamine 5'-phosphate oxidase family protein [Candidatus Saccharimonadales bacterium]|nr:pyridoxamine 5'-phosphate oxidase family protein [Candidatus Saccharimonadales bacterium]
MEHEHEILSYIKKNPVAVVSTLAKDHTLHGAAVYICAWLADQLYFVTKTDTQKFQNILDNPEVAITIVDAAENSSLQASGRASVVKDVAYIDTVMAKMAVIYAQGSDWLPPITKIRAGAYQMIGVKLTQARLAHYKDFRPGDKRIFKEL